MGDVIHRALPAVASLKHSFPGSSISWAIAPQWAPLLDGNVFVDRKILVGRGSLAALLRLRRELRREPFDFAVDFQGLIKSALVASVAWPDRIFGFDRSQVREKPAALFYSTYAHSTAAHVVDKNLDLARAAGAASLLRVFPLPPGRPEQPLPERDFVLACPLAGWVSKQWPLESWTALARRLDRGLGLALVVNGPEASADILARIDGAWPLRFRPAGPDRRDAPRRGRLPWVSTAVRCTLPRRSKNRALPSSAPPIRRATARMAARSKCCAARAR